MKRPIYLDYNATTPVAPEVTAVMLPFLMDHFGNPSSSHPYGQRAKQAVADARESVAMLIGAQADEIVFTGSATEANNLALLGVARAASPGRRHLIVSAVEHPAVMAPAMHLGRLGWNVTVLAVDRYGRVAIDKLRKVLRPDTALVSVMHANNEVGTLQSISEIAALARANGSLMHTDAAQSAGKVGLDVKELGVDLLTLAGHKFYAPKGVGALYVRRGAPITGIFFGANQEYGLRPGTENVPYIVGLGAAAQLARVRLHEAAPRIKALRDALHARLIEAVPGLQLNGHPEHRLPNTLHVSFPGVSGRELLVAVGDNIAASVGSACHSAGDAASGVLAAMAIDAVRASGAVRLSLGAMTTREEVADAAVGLIAAWQQLAR